MRIYVQSWSQISIQEPLCADFLTTPIKYQEKFIQSKDPDFKLYFSASESRRMDKLLKRAFVTTKNALNQADVNNPQAIVAGTGLGCMDNTLHFLEDMNKNNEQFLSPSFFMKSTHNTIASQLACLLKNHTYNATYAHGGLSFESALLDILMQFQLQKIHTALLGAYDEMPEQYTKWLDKLTQWEILQQKTKNQLDKSFYGETSVSFVLSDKLTTTTCCEVKDVQMFHTQNFSTENVHSFLLRNQMNINNVNAVLFGINGNENNDIVYQPILNLFNQHNILIYKHLFGESFTASAFGFLSAALILQKQKLFPTLIYQNIENKENLNNILIYNHFKNKNHSLMLLSSC